MNKKDLLNYSLLALVSVMFSFLLCSGGISGIAYTNSLKVERMVITNSAEFERLNGWKEPTNIFEVSGTLSNYPISNLYIVGTNHPSLNTYHFEPYHNYTNFIISNPEVRDDIQFLWSNKVVITVHCRDGRIELADHMTTNEASKKFWEIVSTSYPFSDMFPTNKANNIKE